MNPYRTWPEYQEPLEQNNGRAFSKKTNERKRGRKGYEKEAESLEAIIETQSEHVVGAMIFGRIGLAGISIGGAGLFVLIER